MTNREEMGKEYYIEDHAVLYGLLLKNAEELLGEKGMEAAIDATVTYARERGLRMAMRAHADGEALTPENYIVYGEWIDYKNWSENKVASLNPEYQTHVCRCGWNDSWRKHGLEKYGEIYCSWVDKNLEYGFNPDNILDVQTFLSHGHPYCDFHWVGVSFDSEEGLKAVGVKKAALAARTVKDFLYHTAHILSAFRREYYLALGLLKGNEILDRAIAQYQEIFGEEKTKALLEESKLDFLSV